MFLGVLSVGVWFLSVVYPVGEIFPYCFVVVYEGFAFVCFIVFLSYEGGGEYGEVVR